MSKEICKRVVITVRGKSPGAIEAGLAEAMRNGYVTGHDANDTGAYYYDVSDDVPKEDWPAK